MEILDILTLILGFVILVLGAEGLVRGASRLAIGLGVSPLIVGLTIVAFGTSAPELTVSIYSSLHDKADVAVGNVVGSNIFNILLILGISAIIVPLRVSSQLIKLDVPLMVASSILVYLMSQNGILTRGNGIILFSMVIAYTVFLGVQAKKERKVFLEGAEDLEDTGNFSVPRCIAFIIVGTIMLVLGSRWLIDGAVAIARYFDISELVIGLTIVALGTSLPEVATSIAAAFKGERDIAVGNVVGSNIFNLLSVLGLSAVVLPNGIPISPDALAFDMPVMVAVAVACLPIFLTHSSISRWEGGLFLMYYFIYVAYIVMSAIDHTALPIFSDTVGYIALPATLLILAVSGMRAYKEKRANS